MSRLVLLFLAATGISAATPRPNIIVVLTDDQDLRFGSMEAMPYTREHLQTEKGTVNLTNFFVNTPICCPSRSTLLSGRMNHNNKATTYEASGGGVTKDGMCMRMNTSQTLNPDFWKNSFVHTLHKEYGYTTAMFGKVLNDMTSYGCNAKTTTNGVDRMFVMCKHKFYNETWIDQGAPDSPPDLAVNSTGDAPDEYTTSLMGNATLRWLRRVVKDNRARSEDERKPFFAWIGPHAPHLPSTPAPWYLDHPIGDRKVPRELNFGVLGADKHAFYPIEPVITDEDAASIQDEYAKRMRSLLSVDDIVREVREFLVAKGEWDNTVMLFTSDHGYNLGGFRVDSHKMQVYDHCTRVPFLIHVPDGSPAAEVDIPTSMIDVGPTLLALAAGGDDGEGSNMDGISFAKLVTRKSGLSTAADWPRDAVLVEYQSIQGGPGNFECRVTENGEEGACDEWRDAYGHGDGKQKRYTDAPNNTYSALRFTRGRLGELLYAEFADVSDPKAWDFAPDRINYYELYNMSTDPFMLRNIYHEVPAELAQELHTRLHKAIACKGAEQCTASLAST